MLAFGGQQLDKVLTSFGARDVIALGCVSPNCKQDAKSFLRFDAFGDNSHTQGMGQINCGLDQERVRTAVLQAEDKGFVDLQFVGRDLFQIRQGRKPGSIIIDGNGYARIAEQIDDPQGLFRVANHACFRDLKA